MGLFVVAWAMYKQLRLSGNLHRKTGISWIYMQEEDPFRLDETQVDFAYLDQHPNLRYLT